MVKVAVAADFLSRPLLSTTASSASLSPLSSSLSSSVTCLRFPFAPLVVLRESRRVFWYIASFKDDISSST